VQEPAWNILAGMNQHGRLALAKLAGAIGSAVLLAIGLLIFKWNLLAAAVGFVVPPTSSGRTRDPGHGLPADRISAADLLLGNIFEAAALPHSISRVFVAVASNVVVATHTVRVVGWISVGSSSGILLDSASSAGIEM